MTCEMNISESGVLGKFCFYESVIHSHARLTYTQVGEVLEKGSHPDVSNRRVPDLRRLHALYKVLRGARDKRGAIDFDTVETRIIFDEKRKIEAIVPVQRNDAHKLIEECMLCANVAAALFFAASKLPILYRVHEGPKPERLENLRSFLGELGLDLRGGEKPTPEHYQELLQAVAERDDASVIQTMMLRSLSQAAYQPENKGHFGLHYEAYAHFTSPIRRYADLLVHRGIRHIVRSNLDSTLVRRVAGAEPIPAQSIFPYNEHAMVAQGEHCSVTERRADEATREVQAWLKCEYLQDHVGDEYAGVISAVTSFGLFVELENIYIEGLIHISALPGDYYNFDAAKQRLTGERSGRSFKLGGSVQVQVARVDLDDKKIDLELIGEAPSDKKQGQKKKQGKKKSPNSNKSKHKSVPEKAGEKKPKPKNKSAKKKAKPTSKSGAKASSGDASKQPRGDT
jgi:ribonuclease R